MLNIFAAWFEQMSNKLLIFQQAENVAHPQPLALQLIGLLIHW